MAVEQVVFHGVRVGLGTHIGAESSSLSLQAVDSYGSITD